MKQGVAITDEFMKIKQRAARMNEPSPHEVEREFIALLRRKDYDHILLIVDARFKAERVLWFALFFLTLTLDVLVRVFLGR